MTDSGASEQPPERKDKLEQGVGRLVVTLVDVLRQLMERQAQNRIEAGSLSDEDTERLGQSFKKLEERMQEIKRVFEIDEQEELDLQLGTLEGQEVSLVELADRVLKRGVALEGDVGLSVADIDLLYVALRVVIASPETAQSLGHSSPETVS